MGMVDQAKQTQPLAENVRFAITLAHATHQALHQYGDQDMESEAALASRLLERALRNFAS